MKLKAVLLNCTLKKSPEPSNTQALMDIVIGHLESLDVECETIRVVDYNVPFGVVSDMGDGDEWPQILEKVIASDAQEPVKSEFRSIVETQTIGIPLGDACTRLYESMPLAESNFFGIVVSIQQKAGGNLSEALGNLSRVLRDRKKMQAKIRAMSMEAKASAVIIGCLPIAVMILVYITSPQYIELLWTTELGRLMLAGCVVWMSIGVFVMKKMINFDF